MTDSLPTLSGPQTKAMLDGFEADDHATMITGVGGLPMRPLSSVEPQEVQWLWKPRIPLGKVSFLEGDPAIGKSWITLAITTAITLGHTPGPHPEPLEGGPGRVLVLNAEDAAGDTIRPRLDSMGADPSRVFYLPPEHWVELDDDGLSRLETAIAGYQPQLVIIDPLVAYLGAGVDMHRSNETRPRLAKLAGIAERHDVAVLLVRHLRKSRGGNALMAGLGSIDFTAAVRSVLLAGRYERDGEEGRCVVHIKSNLVAEGPALGYTLEPGEGFAWGGVVDVHASELLVDSPAAVRPRQVAEEWLTEFLSEGPRRASDVYAAAEEAGIAERTLKRAKTALAVDSERIGFGPDGHWWWSLPGPKEKEGHSGPMGKVAQNALYGPLSATKSEEE